MQVSSVPGTFKPHILNTHFPNHGRSSNDRFVFQQDIPTQGLFQDNDIGCRNRFHFHKVLKNKYNTVAQLDNTKDILNVLGIKVENLTPNELRNLGLQGGVKVTDLKDGKLSEFTDIRKGFIITQIDDEQVNNVDDFVNMLKEKNGKVLVEGIYPNKPMSYLYAFRM